MPFFYIDWTYIILVVPAIIFSLICSSAVNSNFKKYSTIFSDSGITGSQAAQKVLATAGVQNVSITTSQGKLSDHYDPRKKVIALSPEVHSSSSVAAIGVACHEAGHAIQHAKGYVPLKFRNMIIPITNIGSRLSVPLILLGIILTRLGQEYIFIAYIGVACFALSTLFQLVTLPTEFNASKRAMEAIQNNNILSADERKGARKVLSAAAMTYVAALAVSVMQLLRLLIMVRGNDRRR
ncbi:MAG: zinc metallopeptidase [Ruminococcaceae bacterium]|nr:zinc metallopeptidase [Oscillospiraceae bacterium]